jgi:hypothetical protein
MKERDGITAGAAEGRPTRPRTDERPASTVASRAVNRSVLSKDLLRAFFRTPRHIRPDSRATASLRRHARGLDSCARGNPPIGELSSVLGRDSSLAHSFVWHGSSFDDCHPCTFSATPVRDPPISENSSSDAHASLELAPLHGLEIARIVVHRSISPTAGAVFCLSARPAAKSFTAYFNARKSDTRRPSRVFYRPGPATG